MVCSLDRFLAAFSLLRRAAAVFLRALFGLGVMATVRSRWAVFERGATTFLLVTRWAPGWSRIGRCQRARRASRRPIGKAYGGNAIDRSLPSGDSTEPRWGDARRTTGRFAPTRRCSQNGERSHHPCRATGHIPWYAGGAHCEHRGSAKKDQRAYENHP